MSRIALFGLLLVSISSTVVAEVVINESDFGGDFSNLPNDPTQLGVLALGDTVVNGEIITVPDADADLFTFTIDANQKLDAIILDSLDGDRHFFGFDDGNTSDSGNGSQLLVARLIQGSDIGSNLLGPVPVGLNFGGTGVPDTVGPGDYTVWVQENNSGVYAYSLRIQTSASAVPEPSSLIALCGIGAVMGLRRRKRKRDCDAWA